MKMYRLEERILFDGAAAVDVTEQLDKENSSDASASTSTDATVNSDSAASHDAAVSSDVSKDSSSESSVTDDLLTSDNQQLTTDESSVSLDEINSAVVGIIENANPDSSLDSLTTGDWPLTTGNEVAFINSSVIDAQKIIDSFGKDVDVVQLESGKDGLQQITDYLSTKSDVSAVHIITHGNEGYITLNGQVIDSAYVDSHSTEFAQWQNSLTPNADILIYACNTAKGADGEAFVSRIAAVTGADVTASVDGTGGSDGNWALEYNSGAIESKSITASYDYHLANQQVTSNADSGAGTLRQAISDVGEGGEITFALTTGNETITLGSELDISKALTIDGDNTSGSGTDVTLTVDEPGVSQSRIFEINPGAGSDVTICNMTTMGGNVSGPSFSNPSGGNILHTSGNLHLENMTIEYDYAERGGGIYSMGTLEITNCDILSNLSTMWGGGIICHAMDGDTLNISESIISGNMSNYGAAGIFAYGDVTLSECTISDNTVANTGEAGLSGAYAAGIYAAGDFYMNNCTISGNENSDSTGTGSYGGGIFYCSMMDESSSGTITNCTISSNTADYGAGILLDTSVSDTLTITNSTIGENTANVRGGGINGYYENNSPLVIESCTIAYNTSAGNGEVAGIYSNNMTISNSILAGNTNNGVSYDYGYNSEATLALTDNGYNIIGSNTGWTGTGDWNGTDITGSFVQTDSGNTGYLYLDTTFKDNGGPTYTLAILNTTSIANTIPYGDNSWNHTPGTDQRGESRTIDPAADRAIGSYEGTSVPTEGYYYRTNKSGSWDWSVASNWQQSENGTTWTAADLAPDSNSLGIEIRSGAKVAVGSDLTIDQTTIDKGGTITVSSGKTLTIVDGAGIDLTLKGTVVNNGTVLNDGGIDNSGTFTNAGAITQSGTFTSETGSSFAYTGGNQDVFSGTYYNLTLSGTGTSKTAGSSLIVSNVLTVNKNVALDAENLTVVKTLTNSGTIAASGVVSLPSKGSIGGTFVYDGSSDQNIFSGSYYDLMLYNETKTAAGALTVSDNLTVGDDTILDANGVLTLSKTVTNYGTIQASGKVTLSSRADVGGTFIYDGGAESAQAIAAATYSTLRLSGDNSTKNVATGTTTVTDLTVDNGVTLNGGSGTLNISGSWTKHGTFTANKGTIGYTGSDQSMICSVDNPYYNLAISGSATAGSDLLVQGTLTVSQNSTLNVEGTLSVTKAVTNSGTINASNSVYFGNNKFTVGGTFTYNGADQNIAEAGSYNNLTLSGTGTKTSLANLTVKNALAVGENVSLDADGNLSVSKSINNEGTITASQKVTLYKNANVGGTFTYDGGTTRSPQSIAAVSYNNLNVLGYDALSGTTTINNAFAVGAGANFNIKTYTLNLNSSFSIGDGASITVNKGTVNYAVFGSLVENLTTSYYNLGISGGGTHLAAFNLTVNGTLTVASGTYLSATGNLAVGSKVLNSGTIYVSGDVTLPKSATVGGTFVYNGEDSQSAAAANYNQLVLTSSGTKTFASGTTKVSNAVTIEDAMTITGTLVKGKVASTIQVSSPGSSVSRVFVTDQGDGSTVGIENINIKGGNISTGIGEAGYGGAIYAESGTLNLSNVTISGSKAVSGGGIYNAGILNMQYSSVSSNTATGGDGGGIYNNSGTMNIQYSTISSNKAINVGTTGGQAGGIGNYAGTSTFEGITVSSNTASVNAGGLGNTNGTLNIADSTITGNKATGYKIGSTSYGASGGGIANSGGTIDVSASTISSNTATGYKTGDVLNGGSGGGIINASGASMTIYNSTVNNNTSLSGGGIGNYNCLTSTSVIESTTIFGNKATYLSGGVDIDGSDLNIHNSTIAGNTVSSNMTGTPNTGGGGICINDDSILSIRNTIIANNTVKGARRDFAIMEHEETPATITDRGYNIIGVSIQNSGAYTWEGTGDWNIVGTSGDTYQKYASTESGKLQLSSKLAANDTFTGTQTLKLNTVKGVNSIAIDAIPYGDDPDNPWNNSPSTDQRGFTRTVDQPTSIGAYSPSLSSLLLPFTLVALPGIRKMKNRKPVNQETAELVNDVETMASIFDGTSSSFSRIRKHSAFKSDVENLLEQVIA